MAVLLAIQKEKNLNTKKWREIFSSTEQNNRLRQKKTVPLLFEIFRVLFCKIISAIFVYTNFQPHRFAIDYFEAEDCCFL